MRIGKDEAIKDCPQTPACVFGRCEMQAIIFGCRGKKTMMVRLADRTGARNTDDRHPGDACTESSMSIHCIAPPLYDHDPYDAAAAASATID